MTERIIQKELRRFFTNYEYVLFNTFMFAWESDFFAISKSGYSIEIEIKISKQDFKKDFTHKPDKHLLFANHKKAAILQTKHPFKPYIRNGAAYDPDTYNYRPGDSSFVNFTCPANHIPNKFYYACPENLLSFDDVPAYAGLIYIRNTTKRVKGLYPGDPDKDYTVFEAIEVKKAPFLHKVQKNHSNDLLSKYYWKHKNDRVDVLTVLNMLEREVKDLNQNHISAIDRIRQKFT